MADQMEPPRWERRGYSGCGGGGGGAMRRKRRTMPELKPEAQRRSDQHCRQPGAKPCKSLSPFLFPSLRLLFVSGSSYPTKAPR